MRSISLRPLFLPCLLLGLSLLQARLTSAAENAPTPLPPAEAVAAIKLPEGFTATLVAAEPDVVQPISFCLDDRGRLFVAEALNYGAWQATGKDRIVILEDKDGDGRAETRKLFYEGLNYVTGIEVGYGGVWAMSPPSLYFIPDRNGDDVPDGPPEVLFDGFGYKESRHNLVNGFTWGPDGWLYFGHGRTSPSDVGRPGTPAKERIHSDGGVCRVHPSRLVFENFADGTTNPWGVDFDDFGQAFVSNCVNPHLFHMIQGGHYEPWRNRPSSLYAYERLPTCADHLHYPGDKPTAMRGETSETLAMGGGHAHCGTHIYLGGAFPSEYRNTAFMFNVHGKRINHDLLERRGSGYTARHGKDFMIAGDPWFMGVTLKAGPDGSLYLSDWSDTGECHTYRPQVHTGRLFKISYPGAQQEGEAAGPLDLSKLSDAELVKRQHWANDWHVQHARRLLAERAAKPGWKGDAVRSALVEMLTTEKGTPRRLRALWALHVTGGLDAARLEGLLADPAEHLRAWAIQLLCESAPPSPTALARMAEMARQDSSAVVRLYLASALQRLPLESRWEIARGLVAREDASDANLPLMIWYGIEPLVPSDTTRAMELSLAARMPQLRQFVARRLVDFEVARGSAIDLAPLVATLAKAPASQQADWLKGTRDGLAGKKSLKMPAGWPAVYAALARHADRAVRRDVVLLALTFGDPQALADLRKTVQTASAAGEERQAALEALVANRAPELAELLHASLEDARLRQTALRGLASIPHIDTPAKVLAHYGEYSASEKQDAVATLASRKEYALPLLDAVEKQTVARTDLSAFLARQLFALKDPQVTERLRKVWGDVRETSPKKQENMARYKALLTTSFLNRADLSNGRAIYQKTCQNCHRLYGEGGKIGPDLTGSNRGNLEYLLSNIVDPSSEIAQDYRMSVLTTSDGRVITGMVVERTPNRLTIQTATDPVVLSPDDIEEISISPLSMMPEGQLEPMTKEQVRDLIAYLSSKSQVALPAK